MQLLTAIYVVARCVWGRQNGRTVDDGDICVTPLQQMVRCGDPKASRANDENALIFREDHDGNCDRAG